MNSKHDQSSNKRAMPYEAPRITTITAEELMASIGPATAVYGAPPHTF